ncbi:tetratricopeptide repeat-containing diguanylate cyclase [Photobacterium sp. MCCC 1A19761]|uniref:tetratricopeptide repeat-containing diguanylate cyclase n=1 Tax=Photobacterium sp. MCCC 1A19761 TaxID=3115000 RepID=UPI00307EB887
MPQRRCALFLVFSCLFVGLLIPVLPAKADILQPYLQAQVSPVDQLYLETYLKATNCPNRAKEQLRQLERTLKPEENPVRQALHLLASLQIELADMEGGQQADLFLAQLAALGEKSKLAWIEAEARYYQGVNLVDRFQLEAAQATLQAVEATARELGYEALRARALKWLGNIDADRDRLQSALVYYHQAYQIFNKQHDFMQVAKLLSNTSTVYMRMEVWPKAEEYLNRAIELYHANHYSQPATEASLHINASLIDKYFDRGAQRQVHLREAHKLAEQTSSYRLKMATLLNLADIQLDLAQSREAYNSASRCLIMSYRNQDEKGTPYCNVLMASALLQMGQPDQAKTLALASAEKLDERDDRKFYLFATKITAESYEALGEYQQALTYYKRYIEDSRDYLIEARRQAKIVVQQELGAELEENELTLLKAENALQTARIATQNARENVWLLAAVVGTLGLYILYGQYSRIRRRHHDLAKSHAELAIRSGQDVLTGLSNRRFVENWLRTKATKLRQPLMVAVLDVDHFKRINDTLGHDVGDQVLVELAARMKRALPADDMLARWGGEEFVAVMRCEPKVARQRLAALQQAIIEKPFETTVGERTITVSIGATMATSGENLAADWETLLKQADSALYQVKHNGRNSYLIAEGQ